MRRVAQVIRVLPEKVDEYRALHRDVPQPVLDRLGLSYRELLDPSAR
ncbi:L-rhamnose mutarotase [Streptomyces poriferorum]|nr:L-rhamnose mutarotase [Streptomyces sp. Alt1]WLQ46101.1 L-rhamnose mutarotase [Streptomyces sp. Alt1]